MFMNSFMDSHSNLFSWLQPIALSSPLLCGSHSNWIILVTWPVLGMFLLLSQYCHLASAENLYFPNKRFLISSPGFMARTPTLKRACLRLISIAGVQLLLFTSTFLHAVLMFGVSVTGKCQREGSTAVCLCVCCACTYVPLQDAGKQGEVGREPAEERKTMQLDPCRRQQQISTEWNRLSGVEVVGVERM